MKKISVLLGFFIIAALTNTPSHALDWSAFKILQTN